MINFGNPGWDNFQGLFFTLLKDMPQTIGDLQLNLCFYNCVHICNDKLLSSTIEINEQGQA